MPLFRPGLAEGLREGNDGGTPERGPPSFWKAAGVSKRFVEARSTVCAILRQAKHGGIVGAGPRLGSVRALASLSGISAYETERAG